MAVRFHDMFAVVPHSFLRIYGFWRTWSQIAYGALRFRLQRGGGLLITHHSGACDAKYDTTSIYANILVYME
jgi:hypothetical protein